ncbi:MAG: AI-2E family transporter [Muribaculaceae bacterium]|nr:AI-2E family transporter [Muribaculaceae bacterium]
MSENQYSDKQVPENQSAGLRPRVPAPFTFDRVVRIIFTIAGLLGALYLIDILKGVLLPFVVACLLAYILEPIVKFNQRMLHTRARFFPVILTLIEMLALFTLGGILFVPYLVEECTSMAATLSKYATTQIHIPYVSDQIHQFLRENLNPDVLLRWMSREEWMRLVKQTLSSSWSFLSSSLAVVIGLISWLIVVLYLIFIMLDYDRLMLSFRQLVPLVHRPKVFRIIDDVKNAMNRYFRGQFLIAMIVGVLFSIGFLIIDLPMAVVLGLFIGVLNLVPYLQLISLPITALLCLIAYVSTGVDFWTIFWEAMAVYVVVQCIQDLYLTPRIMGKAMGLNPAIILLSLSIWGCLLGFMGLIIALPLTTLLLSYYDTYIVKSGYRG